MIEIKNLDVVFGKQAAQAIPLLEQGLGRKEIQKKTGMMLGVQDASLKIEKGEICVLMGLSGSGKSSLLRCINGLNPITRGSVKVEHKGKMLDLAHCDDNTLREIRTQRISMVFQKFALMPWLTVEQNVALPLELQGLNKSDIQTRVAEQLDIVGLSQWRKLKPSELSGGMQQRVGLARALVTESDILLMDEPFSALDPLIRTQLQDELLQLQEKLQKTIVFVSHDLDEALKLGNNIAIMKDGIIAQHGKPQDIVLNPADDYVRDFVAHTNPVNVLEAESIMRPLSELESGEKGYCLSKRHDYWLTTAKDAIIYRGESNKLQRWTGKEPIASLQGTGTVVDAHTSMRDVLEIRYDTDHAVFIEKNNKIVGFVGDKELYHSLLGKMLTND